MLCMVGVIYVQMKCVIVTERYSLLITIIYWFKGIDNISGVVILGSLLNSMAMFD